MALHVDLLGGAVYHKSRSYPLEIDVIEFVFVLLMDYFQKTYVEIWPVLQNQINMYNESCNNESVVDAER